MAGVIFNLFPQAPHRHVDGPDIAEIIVAPDGLQEVLPVDDLADVLGQIVEQFELPVGQVDVLAPLGDRVGLRVDRQITDLDIGVLLFFGRGLQGCLPSQVSLDPGH